MFRLLFVLLASGLLFAVGNAGPAAARGDRGGCNGDERPSATNPTECVKNGPAVKAVTKNKIMHVKKAHK